MSQPLQHRYEFVLLFDVKDGNPNGDPDAGNLPRLDVETGHGLVTDVCLKRKVRNYVGLIHGEQPPYEIYVKEKAVLNRQHERAYQAVETASGQKPDVEAGRRWMCQNFYDVRTFGAVMSTGDHKCGQVRGPIQLTFARSNDPVISLEHSITRMAVTTDKEAENQKGDNRTMGRKHTVPYGLYRTNGFISAPLAEQTGFSEDDLELFWNALTNMFDHDHSAARGQMNTCGLYLFKHSSKLGNAPSHQLFETIQITRRDPNKPARDFADYQVTIHQDRVPSEVSLIRRVERVPALA
jgi:CRISPR-associated protein Csd2